ncbi:MAG: thioredoxin domain-containing protein [Phormidesmis sp.]
MTSEPKNSPSKIESNIDRPEIDRPKADRPKADRPKTGKWWVIGLALASVLTVGAAFVLLQRPAATPEPADALLPAAETPEAEAEAEAAARAEWEAQMQQVNAVVQSMDRATLVGDSPTKGSLDAPVVLIKFSDFQCPYCAVAASEMKTFTAGHEEDVLYVYKHFPLVSIHEEALPAAKATWAAAQQDQFWLYHDGLFAFQEKLGEDYYVELAAQIGLDVEQFERDRNSPEAEAAVAKDAELASELGLRGTPSFLMTNSTDSFLLPGGAPLEIFAEATQRLKDAAAKG